VVGLLASNLVMMHWAIEPERHCFIFTDHNRSKPA